VIERGVENCFSALLSFRRNKPGASTTGQRVRRGATNVVETCNLRKRGGGSRATGFTLIEILVALAVLSVATTVILSLFSSSVSLGQRDRSQRAAYSLAEQHLSNVAINSTAYEWPDAETLSSGELIEIPASTDDRVTSDLPTTLPTFPAANSREQNFHARFTSNLYVRAAGVAGVCEVTAVVRWKQDGRDQSISLTTTIPTPSTGGES
jgi:prepilin-type N-terminal cleavage/methylation domain-containing protein